MSQAIKGVVGEWECHSSLESDLGGDGESAKSSSQRGRLEMPAKQWGGEVCGSEEVERARHGKTGKTVGSTTNPGDLGLVDGKVGRDRAVQSLLGEEPVRVGSVGGRSVSNTNVSIAPMVNAILLPCSSVGGDGKWILRGLSRLHQLPSLPTKKHWNI